MAARLLPDSEPIPWPPRAAETAATSETEAASRLQQLRETIRSIERRPAMFKAATLEATSANPAARAQAQAHAWTLGEPEFDWRLGAGGLAAGAVHEIKPAAPDKNAGMPGPGGMAAGMPGGMPAGMADWAATCAAARRFALALAVRRLASAPAARHTAPLLFCASAPRTAELGRPYGPGLAALGLDPGRLIVVEPARSADVLWAIEEGLKSAGLALVLGEVDEVGLTPARRLALAAARSETPCLLLTHPRGDTVAATATRWRIAPAPSAPHPLDPEAPGAARLLVGLERCRGSAAAPGPGPSLLEWCDAAFRLRVAPGMADRAPCAHQSADGPRRAVGQAG